MKRLGRAVWLIADIWLAIDRLLKVRFIAGGAPPDSVHHHIDMMEHVLIEEEVGGTSPQHLLPP
jgi:hypothetical protein